MRENIENRLAQAVRGRPDRVRTWAFQRPAFQPAADDAHGASRFAARVPFWGSAAPSGPAPSRWFCAACRSDAPWLFIGSSRTRTNRTLLRLVAAPRGAFRVSPRAPVFCLEFQVWRSQNLRPIGIEIGRTGCRGFLCSGRLVPAFLLGFLKRALRRALFCWLGACRWPAGAPREAFACVIAVPAPGFEAAAIARVRRLTLVLALVVAFGGHELFDINRPSAAIGRLATLDPLALLWRLAIFGAQRGNMFTGGECRFNLPCGICCGLAIVPPRSRRARTSCLVPRSPVIAARTRVVPRLARQNIDNYRRFVSGMKRARKIRARGLGERRSELIAQDARAHLLDRALGEFAELERSEGQPYQAVDLKPDMFEHALDLAVLAFAQRHR